MIPVKKVIDSILGELNPRQKEVIIGRFGLDGQKPKTLASIGDRYGLTRERIRQIENSALAITKNKMSENPDCTVILAKSKKHLDSVGGIAKKDSFIKAIESHASGLGENHLAFLAEASGAFNVYDEDKDFWPFYYSSKEKLNNLNRFIKNLTEHLKSKKDAVLTGSYHGVLKDFIQSQKVNENHAKSFISTSKKIHQNPYGDIGLSEWPEIKPQNIKDKIYLVLKKRGKPLHFETIAEEINKTSFDNRKALSPTVHNELIKDSRFVLVGRGIYALKEHGYQPGTVQEVIRRILRENGPLNAKDISLAIQKERIIKPNTILVNLQNRKFFERLEDGSYRVRQD